MTTEALRRTVDAYIDCALWASTDDEGTPLDDPSSDYELAEEARESMRAEVADFLELLEREGVDVSELGPEQVGHDFWLTRNRHGAGFWDRGLGDLGDTLTQFAHSYGESDLYIGDDGRLYVSP